MQYDEETENDIQKAVEKLEGQKAVEKLEGKLTLPSGFFNSLLKEDDWSFVIKCHALLEAVLSTWIALHLKHESLLEPLSHLATGDQNYGKVAITKALNMTTDFDRKFLSELSKLRNSLVHQVSNVSFSFNNYLQKLDKNQKRNFTNAFGYCYYALDDNGKAFVKNHEKVLHKPKETIWHSLRMFMAIVQMSLDTEELKKKVKDLGKDALQKDLELEKQENKRLNLLTITMRKFLTRQ